MNKDWQIHCWHKYVILKFNNLSKLLNTIFNLSIKIKVGYLISWCPYALVSMYSAFIDPNDISTMVSTIPSMFAKSSFVWSTILFIYSNSEIKKKLYRIFIFKTIKKPNLGITA